MCQLNIKNHYLDNEFFYLGFVYTGPQLCQDVMDLYLKIDMEMLKHGVRKWSLITLR